MYLECTTTDYYGGNSGIQRVVRNVVASARAVGAELGLDCRPVVWTGEKFVSIDATSLNQHGSSEAGGAQQQASRLREMLKHVAPLRAVVRLLPWRLRWLLNVCVDRLSAAIGLDGDRRACETRPEAHFVPGDVLLLLDSSWHTPLWAGVNRARRDGARIGGVIYDLIPVRLPHVCHASLVPIFQSWIVKASREVEFWVAISASAAQDMRDYLHSHSSANLSGTAQPQVGHFHLGAGLDLAKLDGLIRPELSAAFTGPRTYLAVGTLEPRKNHAYLLDAFDRLWAGGDDASLVIVGKVGWLCEDLTNRIRGHEQFGKRLFTFNDASDAELGWCYRNAAALVFSSIAEGFGLPIVEAMAHGLTVLASDIPVHREVGGNHCVYFDLKTPDSLADLLRQHVRTGKLPPHESAESFHWPTWADSTRQLLLMVQKLSK